MPIHFNFDLAGTLAAAGLGGIGFDLTPRLFVDLLFALPISSPWILLISTPDCSGYQPQRARLTYASAPRSAAGHGKRTRQCQQANAAKATLIFVNRTTVCLGRPDLWTSERRDG